MGAALSQDQQANMAAQTPALLSVSPATQESLQRKRLAAMAAKRNMMPSTQAQPAPTIGAGVSALKQRLGE